MRQSDSAYPKLGVIHAAILSIMGSRYSPQRGRPLEPSEIARLLGVPLKRALPALGALGRQGLLNCRGRQWSLTETGQAFVDDNAPPEAAR